ncbi:MAG: hypothetical protein HY934_07775, partial [Candidatus Firestonebacteria bacterium]|nr:hypothetical protein [Candidatus Firestonebacteria bacterium]
QYNIFGYTWDSTKYVEQIIDNRAEPSISAAYANQLPYPNIAIAYGGGSGLYYTLYDTSYDKWTIKIIEVGPGVGKDISLQIDINGNPHISYTDSYKQCLKYCYYYDSTWYIQTIDNGPEVGRFSNLQLDQNQYPHIAYYDAKNGALKYIYFNGNKWNKEVIDIEDKKMLGLYISFKMDKIGNRHISYYNATDHYLKYAYSSGLNWQIEVVDTTGITGLYTSLSFDNKNNPNIIYNSNGMLKYTYKDISGDWIYEVIDNTFGSGASRSKLILDEENNKKHVFYFVNKYSSIILKYACYINGKWEIKLVKNYGGLYYYYFSDFDVTSDINNELWLFSYYYGVRSLGPDISSIK